MTPREIGITFLAWCIPALLAGDKTSTMRLMKEQPTVINVKDDCHKGAMRCGECDDFGCHDNQYPLPRAPFGPVGTTFYIREKINHLWGCDAEYCADEQRVVDVLGWDVWENWPPEHFWQPRVYPSIHMHKRLARPQRWRIPKIAPMRVQDTTEEIAQTEGIERVWMGREKRWKHGDTLYETALTAFRVAWDEIHPGSWDRNDWVWRYHEFEPLDAAQDKEVTP